MKPLISVCALRIWKIRSCLRMPVAPATFRSLAIWVSFWMLRSFRSLMFSVWAGLVCGRGASPPVGARKLCLGHLEHGPRHAAVIPAVEFHDGVIRFAARRDERRVPDGQERL